MNSHSTVVVLKIADYKYCIDSMYVCIYVSSSHIAEYGSTG